MINIILENVNVGMQDLPQGHCILAFEDLKSGIQVQIPMNKEQRGIVKNIIEGKQLVAASGIPDEILRNPPNGDPRR